MGVYFYITSLFTFAAFKILPISLTFDNLIKMYLSVALFVINLLGVSFGSHGSKQPFSPSGLENF